MIMIMIMIMMMSMIMISIFMNFHSQPDDVRGSSDGNYTRAWRRLWPSKVNNIGIMIHILTKIFFIKRCLLNFFCQSFQLFFFPGLLGISEQ